jgi:hypothetical protein
VNRRLDGSRLGIHRASLWGRVLSLRYPLSHKRER